MNWILNTLPITRIKIFIARILYLVTKLFVRKDEHIIERNGTKYNVDISEGLDLSLFLFGNFQSHVAQNKYINLPQNAYVFDVGANIGVMSLQFAKMVPKGKVYAFEPTHYAFNKLRKNIELNPELGSRIELIQTFLTCDDKLNDSIKAYSSWKVGKNMNEEKHPVHLGTAMSTEGVGSTTLDEFCKKNGIERLDLIKIDTDGHEPDVLEGAKRTIEKFKPKVIFEIGQYVMHEHGIDFNYYLSYFNQLGYKLTNSTNLRVINNKNWRRIIPLKGTIDILAYM